jgi:hypothetical protein
MFVSVIHDTPTQTLTITIREDKIVQLAYANLPPGWELDAPSYEGFVVDYLNELIEERYDRKTYWRDRNVKNSDVEFDGTQCTSERFWLDTVTDELVFVECVVTKAKWDIDSQQYIITIRNTSPELELQREIRGAWINPPAFRTESKRTETLDKVLRGGLNTLFVIAPPIGENEGWSEPDDFASFISGAKSEGLTVHGWVANKYRIEGQEADFGDIAEQDAQVQWAIDLLTEYPTLDGFHLDYIRYSWENVSLERMNGITETVRKIKEAMGQKQVTAAVFRMNPMNWNVTEDEIPDWFTKWYANNPNSWFETYYSGNAVPQFMKYQQDPVIWANNDYADAIIPMQYTLDDVLWNKGAEHWKIFLPEKHVYMGLGWENHNINPTHIVNKIKSGRELGVNGFVIFQLGGKKDGEFINDEPLIEALTIDSNLNDWSAPFK